jgi:hypothetical protein
MNGVTGSAFGPETAMTRAMFVTTLYRLENSPAVTGKVSEVFTDCADGAWYASAVLWASENGIVNGVTAASFAPAETLTREQMATMLYRYAVYSGAPEETGMALPYADAASIHDWALPGVAYCTGAGLMNGRTAEEFAPLGTASRAMGTTVLSRLAA